MDPLAFTSPPHTAGPAFASSRVLRLSDLPVEEQDSFIKFFAEQKLAFFKDVDGSYVTNIRLYDPSVVDLSASQKPKKAKEDGKLRRGGPGGASASDDAFTRLVADLSSSTASASGGLAVDYSVYGRFTSLISPRGEGGATGKPKARPIAWLMKNIEEIYDQRYAKDTADLRGEGGASAAADGGEGGAGGGASGVPFPQFVVEFLSKRYGLRGLIDQHAWDLLYNTHLLRKEHLEVETFARFLEEHYDADDLLFFLYVRSVVQKEINVSFRTRWGELGRGGAAAAAEGTTATSGVPAPLFLTVRECQIVSRVVFGSESDPLYRTFMAMIDRHLTTPPPGTTLTSVGSSATLGARRPSSRGFDTRRIEVTQFLHLALVEYHETRPADDAELSAVLGSGLGMPALASASGGAAAAGGSPAGGAGSSAASSPAGSSSSAAAAQDALSEQLYREAEAMYAERLRGGSGASASASPAGAAAAPATPAGSSSSSSSASGAAVSPSAAAVSTAAALLRRTPTFFDDLGNAMHRANNALLDRSLAAAGGLPREVQAQIRAEVQNQLEGKLDVILAAVIRSAQTGSATGSDTGKDALVAHFTRVMAAAAGEAPATPETSVDAFCEAVLRHPEVTETVTPLVTLLVSYATSRLQDGTTGTAVPATYA